MGKTKLKVIKSLLSIVTKGSLVTGLVASSIIGANAQSHFVSQSGSPVVTKLSAESDLNKSSSPAKNDGQSINTFLDNKDGTLLLKVGQQEAFKVWIKNTQKGSVTLGQIGGTDVTNIGTVFQNVDVLTSITLPTTLEIIGAGAFNGCTSLATVNLGQLDKLTTIGANAFGGCTALKSVTIPAGVTAVADNAFAPNTAIVNNTKTLFKAYVNSNGKDGVFNTPKLYLALADDGKYVKIADNAFANLTKIEEVIIPENIRNIGANAFGGCTSLKTVRFVGNIGDGDISIGKGAFPTPSQGKIKFHFINQNSLNSAYGQIDLPIDKKECIVDVKSFFDISDQGVLTVKGDRNNLKQYLQAQGGMLDISALDNVKVINDAFRGYDDLKDIILPTSLTTIGVGAFKGCTSLATVNLGQLDKLTTIGTNAFGGCTALTSATIPANVTAVADNAFAPNTVITNNTKTLFKAYVNSNGKDGVFNTPKLNLVFVDDGKYVKIADNAFANLTKIEEVIISENIRNIGANAFGGCTSLKIVKFSGNIGDGDISIGKGAFPTPSQGKIKFHFATQNSLGNVCKQIDLPADKRECIVDVKSFFDISDQGVLTVKGDGGNLKKYLQAQGGILDISALDNVKVINDAFRGYDGLKGIILPANLTTIGAGAFKGCTSLATVNLGQLEKLTTIGTNAFGGCTALTSATIPANVTAVADNAFAPNTVITNNTKTLFKAYVNSNGKSGVFNTPKLDLTFVDGGRYATIADNAFANLTKIEEVIISENIRNIGANAFGGCTSLKIVKFSGNIGTGDISIGNGAFPTPSQGKIKFHFATQNSLDNVCKQIDLPADKRECIVDVKSFFDISDQGVLTVKGDGGNLKKYLQSQGGVLDISALRNVRVINDTFRGYDGLKGIILPANLTTIGAGAFKGCTSLATVNLGRLDRLTTIGTNAFDGCTALTSVTIPANVTAVADNAFAPNTAIVNNTKILFKAYVNSNGKSDVFNTPKLYLALVDGGRYVTIADNALANLTKIEEVIIPGNIGDIGANAFGGCTSLKTVRFDGNIGIGGISIGKGSFPIPSEGKIGFYFINQDSLNNVRGQIDLPADKREYFVDVKSFFDISDQGVLTVKGDGNNLKQYLQAQGGMLDISALDNVNIINDAFRGYNDLKNVILPTSLTTIGAGAFNGCTSLATVNLGQLEKLTTIGANAFGRCTALTSATIPANVTAVADSAFAPNTAIVNNTKILFKAYVNSNGKSDVFNTPKLNLVFVDDGKYETIADNAFANLTKIEDVIIPARIKKIGANAFSGCTGLKTVKFSGNIWPGGVSVGKGSFPTPSQGKIEFHFITQNSLDSVCKQIDLPTDKKECIVDFKDFFHVDKQGVLTIKGDGGNLKQYLQAQRGVLNIIDFDRVKVINDYAFRGYYGLKCIVLPMDLERIGAGAFRGCTSLVATNVGDLDKLTTIGNNAFSGCTSLAKVTIPANVTAVADNAFAPNTAIVNNTKILFKAYVNSNGKDGVFNMPKLNLTLVDGGGYETIADNAFANLTKIEEVIIPETIKEIGANAFGGCTSLDTVVFAGDRGDEDISIGKGAFPTPNHGEIEFHFVNLDSLKNVYDQIDLPVDKKECIIDFKNLFFVDGQGVLIVKGNGNDLKQYLQIRRGVLDISSVFNNVKVINDAFQDYDGLKSIILPKTLERIGANAFKYCTSLIAVNLGQLDKLTTIGANAFGECTALTRVTIPANVTAVADNAFAPNTAIVNKTKILFKAYVNSNGKRGVFNTPELFLDLVDGGKYVKIADNAFADLMKIKDVIIPETIKEIGANAFGGCVNLKRVRFDGNIGDGDISIGKGAFPTPNHGEIEFHFVNLDSVKNVYDQIDLPIGKKKHFVDFESFFNVNRQGVLTVKGNGNDLKQYLWIRLGMLDISALDNVKVILNDAFRGYNDLRNIILPTSLTTIGAGAFKGCAGLATVNLGQLGRLKTIGANAFDGCTALKSVTIPAGVTAVADNAFAPNTAIVNKTKILFKAYVNSNGKSGVFNTPKLNLASIDGGKYVTIADNAFANLTKIEDVIIPGRIKEIGVNAFSGCTSLKTVVFACRGGGVRIGKGAFPTPSQGKIEFYFINHDSFNNVYNKIDLPVDKKEYFVDFKNILYISGQGVLTVKGNGNNLKQYLQAQGGMLDISDLDSVKVINDVFRGYDGLKSIILPTTLERIGADSFKDCTSLATVNFDQLDKLTTIGKDAFGGCNALKSIAIPASITDIGTNAFDGCTSLKEVTFMGKNRDITLGSDVFMKDKVEKFLFEDQPLLDALKNQLDAGIVETKCSVITSEWLNGAVIGTILAAIFASICFIVGIAVLIRKRKMNALHHQDDSQTELNG